MKKYLVGGAVRDALLGRPTGERDWVVLGATAGQLLAQGFRQVGKDFPVFLHPTTGEEHALARTEIKTAPGYHGFTLRADPDVTLKEDLQRRDLTINAMARDQDTGELIDPYGGLQDLQGRKLRHVSAAFSEDPVRILRVARFVARYDGFGFEVAPETMQLMRDMVACGEVDHLVAERVWAETRRALLEPAPWRFIEVLRECGALARVFPEIERLFGVPQPPRHHPEIDTGVHTLMVLRQAAATGAGGRVRFAALVHDLGKGTTPKSEWPRHIGHEKRSAKLVTALCLRLRIPNDWRDLAVLVARYHSHCHRALELRATTLLNLLEALGAFRSEQRLGEFLQACEADARGRTGLQDRAYPQVALLRAVYAAAAAVQASEFVAAGLKGVAIGEAMRETRLRRIREARRQFPDDGHQNTTSRKAPSSSR